MKSHEKDLSENTLKAKNNYDDDNNNNEICRFLWDFVDTNGSPNLARPPDQKAVNKNKENLQNCWLCCLGWPESKIERKRKE